MIGRILQIINTSNTFGSWKNNE